MLLAATIVISGCATLNQQPDPYVGQWNIEFSRLPQGDPNATITIAKEEGAYSGIITNSRGEFPMSDVVIEANNLSANFNYQGYSVAMTAVFDGTTISGQNAVNGRTFTFAGEKVEE